MPATRNIVFDWNSTLFDDIETLHACTNVLLATEGHEPVTIDFFRAHYNVPFELFYKGMGFTDADVTKIMSLENSAFHDHYEAHAAQAELRQGANDILAHAKERGLRNYILSNHLVEPIRTQLRRFSIEDLFVEVLAYATRAVQFRDMTKGERLRRFMAEHKMVPEHTFIVGDSVEEVHIAKELGLISVAITGGCVSEERLRAEHPDYLIHELPELKPILKERGFVS